MEQDTAAFDTLELLKFDQVKLFRASDTEGGGWNQYGIGGPVRISIIKESYPSGRDYRGWGQMTFHNCLTGAGGLNVLLVPNFPMLKEENRITFKALSQVVGSNGKKNMFSMKLASSEDAARLWYAVFVLQLAAKQAKAGNPITIPNPDSIETTIAHAFIGSDQEAIERQLVLSSLGQLAIANRPEFSSPSLQPPFEVGDLDLVGENERASAVETGTSDVAVSTQVTHDEVKELGDCDDDDDSSTLGSYSDFVESQDWFASFTPHKK